MRGSTAGLEPDTMKGESATHYAFLSFLDSVFSAAVVTPAVVAFWRSVWELMGLYVYPNNSLYSAITSTIIGVLGHLMFALSQHAFEYFHPDKNRMVYYLVSRVYTVCFAFVCVNGWRGPWSLLDIYTQPNLTSVVVPTALGVVALASIRALRNVSAPPCAIVTDYVKGYFEVVTMFRVPMVQRTSLYILDCLFSVLIVGTLVVFVWRGAWVLIDIYLFPEMADWSAWASLVLGYMSVAVAFLMQPAMRWLCDRINGAARLFAADVFLLFSLFGTLNVWRGIWNLLNIYFLPDNLELSCWITHWVSLILLILLGCSNSLLVRGVYIDAEEPAGKCVVFPCYYLRLIFQQAREKKNGSSSVQLESMSKRKQEIDAKYADGNDVKQISINMESNHI